MKEAISALVKKIKDEKLDAIKTEEATKMAFVLPFLSALGYNVFNTNEVNPEYPADVGMKHGEKVDYVIVIDGEPALVIECKQCRNELSVEHESQLIRYFNALKSKLKVSLFAVLTNGIIYKFFTDNKAKPNVLDITPFFEIDLSKPKNIDYGTLEKFSRTEFKAGGISTIAGKLKTTNAAHKALDEELTKPSDEFVHCIFKKMNAPDKKTFTLAIKEELKPIIIDAIAKIITDRVETQLTEALAKINKKPEELAPKAEENQDEIDAYNIIKAIISEIANPALIAKRPAKSYCAILFDDNNRRPVCRLYLKEPNNKSIVLLDTDPEEIVKIDELNEIFSLRPRLLATVKKYIS